jgi:RNA polymerase sigma-70 factor (ECF subfamily)
MERARTASLETRVATSLAAGDLPAAATAAVRGYGPELLSYLYLVLHDREAAHDVFAETCMDFWRSLERFRGDCSVRTWLYKLAWNAASNFRRDERRRRERRLDTTEISQLAAEVSRSVGSKLAALDRRQKLRKRLDPEEQTLLTLRLDRALSWKEVALVLACDEVVLRKRFERLKEKLRRLVLEEGPSD